jgi:uncharacterized protein involved in type VI secretion and phage assembly
MSFLLREHSLALVGPGAYLATVIDVADPDHLNRVKVRVFSADSSTDSDAPLWARVAVPFAGANKGAFLFPDTGDEVLVVFLSGDVRFPVVIGSFWNGRDKAPDQFGSSVDKWTFTGKAGTKIAIDESSGQGAVKFTTPNGQTGTLTDDGGGSIELKNATGSSIKIDAQGITINSTMKVTVNAASSVDVTAAQVNVTAAMSRFSGTVKCDVMQATTVIATTYTPGAGNVW